MAFYGFLLILIFFETLVNTKFVVFFVIFFAINHVL